MDTLIHSSRQRPTIGFGIRLILVHGPNLGNRDSAVNASIPINGIFVIYIKDLYN